MLILVKVAPAPVPDDDADDSGEKKSEVKTGFHVLAAAGGGSTSSESSGGSPSGGGGARPGGGGGGMLPLGTCREIIKAVGGFNVYPDGSGAEGWGSTPGMATLYGPGCVIELPTGGGDDSGGRSEAEISQAMVTISDEEFAWPVLSRICKANAWKMMDPESGRMFG